MNNINSLSHSRWECKYHVVWIPKCRREALYGHFQSDHVHMLIAIPPKHAVAKVIGYINCKSAIHIVRSYLGQRKNYGGG